jgi:hypothetical protein
LLLRPFEQYAVLSDNRLASKTLIMRLSSSIVAFTALFAAIAIAAPTEDFADEFSPLDTRDVLTKRFTACSVSSSLRQRLLQPSISQSLIQHGACRMVSLSIEVREASHAQAMIAPYAVGAVARRKKVRDGPVCSIRRPLTDWTSTE